MFNDGGPALKRLGRESSGPRPEPGGGESWLLVAGDFTPLGGMDCANHALAAYLGRRAGPAVHLVTHRAWPDLEALQAVRVHRVNRPWGSHLAGLPLLAAAGWRLARRLAGAGPLRVVVNGGNCPWGDINWVHYLHAAWSPRPDGSLLRRGKARLLQGYGLASERANLRRARLVIANSHRTRAALLERLDLKPEWVHTVYYGIDPARFRPPEDAERAEARAALGLAAGVPAVAFVGGLGDRRKGFDTLLAAWQRLARRRDWDARLVVVGAGAALPRWRARVAAAGLDGSVQFLGFRADVPRLLGACDALVSPVRYEAYGLNVHEALCCGRPALVSAAAGVAERYPAELAGLLLSDPEDPAELAARLEAWRAAPEALHPALAALGQALRARTWDHCAAELVALASAAGPG
jgi:glycosyltransferase involved in cell wall biosynthesis